MRGLALILLLSSVAGQDPAVRKLAFEELRQLPDQGRLRKALVTHGTAWLRKAVSERTRALRALPVASRRGFNPVEIAAKQKQLLGLLAAGNTKAMEAPV